MAIKFTYSVKFIEYESPKHDEPRDLTLIMKNNS